MERQFVSSSHILSIGYDPSSMTLEVEFKTGAVYQYYDASEAEYRAFISSSSLGHEISVIDKTHSYSRVC